jgi:excisionase family DNA binding protein
MMPTISIQYQPLAAVTCLYRVSLIGKSAQEPEAPNRDWPWPVAQDEREQSMQNTDNSNSYQVKKAWEPLLTPIEAAELLRIHPKTALRLARIHGIPAIRLGKHWRFRACDLRSWAESQIEPCIEFSGASS